ncbi:Tropinesterase [Drechslerella dactyloides]|uniref:Tropinesterase n=1 Tax=Drechslerella dactyloides TaxID=74499 RepID=A0AAD6J319_DREDA|nr:Tropinesterase [Drechslerella dactyloides]
MRSVNPIHPTDDSRVKHASAAVNGVTLHYVIGEPEGPPRATVLCIHGFPDLWYTWRYQIPALLALDLRVIAVDCLGYGGSSAPKGQTSLYSLKRNADALAALLDHLSIPAAILLAHDWGSMIAFRLYNYHPAKVSHIISLCVPYAPPHPSSPYLPLSDVVRRLPNFAYQIALADPQTERDMAGPYNIRRFLKAMYRGVGDGRTAGVEININVTRNIMDAVGDVPMGWILSEEEMEWYVDQFDRVGMHGPLSYYRTRRENHDDEKVLHDPVIKVPVLFLGASRDAALPPSMAAGQGRFIPDLTTRTLECSHWMAWEKTDEVNALIASWLDDRLFGPRARL